MKQYHDLLNAILAHGTDKPAARENMPGTISLFGYQLDPIDLSEGFPLLTTKRVKFKNIVVELLWFLRGDTNIKYLNDNGFKLWNEDAYNYYKKTVKNYNLSYDEFIDSVLSNPLDADENFHLYKSGDCGYQYGKVWRDFNGVDQISRLIKGLKENPQGRRHIITAMDPANDEDLALYWCHNMFQFNARPIETKDIKIEGGTNNAPKYYLDCKLYQRSADVFLGVPYNIASYALLTHLIARIVNMIPGKYIHTFGDVHIYDNHINQVNEILSNDIKKYDKPKLKFSSNLNTLIDKFNGDKKLKDDKDFGYYDDFDNFIHSVEIDDIYLENYKSFPYIKAKLSTGLK